MCQKTNKKSHNLSPMCKITNDGHGQACNDLLSTLTFLLGTTEIGCAVAASEVAGATQARKRRWDPTPLVALTTPIVARRRHLVSTLNQLPDSRNVRACIFRSDSCDSHTGKVVLSCYSAFFSIAFTLVVLGQMAIYHRVCWINSDRLGSRPQCLPESQSGCLNVL